VFFFRGERAFMTQGNSLSLSCLYESPFAAATARFANAMITWFISSSLPVGVLVGAAALLGAGDELAGAFASVLEGSADVELSFHWLVLLLEEEGGDQVEEEEEEGGGLQVEVGAADELGGGDQVLVGVGSGDQVLVGVGVGVGVGEGLVVVGCSPEPKTQEPVRTPTEVGAKNSKRPCEKSRPP
jgi:hypothetical protein